MPVEAAASKLNPNVTLVFLSGFSFFAYLFHLYPLQRIVTPISSRLAHEPFRFYLEFPLSTILVFSLAYVLSKYLEPLYRTMTGGRSPEKMLSRTATKRSN